MAKGNVEIWLGDLLREQQSSLHGVIRFSAIHLSDPSFELHAFLETAPAQVNMIESRQISSLCYVCTRLFLFSFLGVVQILYHRIFARVEISIFQKNKRSYANSISRLTGIYFLQTIFLNICLVVWIFTHGVTWLVYMDLFWSFYITPVVVGLHH